MLLAAVSLAEEYKRSIKILLKASRIMKLLKKIQNILLHNSLTILRKCHHKLTWTWSFILPQIIRAPTTSNLSKLLSHQHLSTVSMERDPKTSTLGVLNLYIANTISLRWEFTKQWKNLVLLSPTIQPLISNSKRSIPFFKAFPILSLALLLCSITLRLTFIFLFHVKLKTHTISLFLVTPTSQKTCLFHTFDSSKPFNFLAQIKQQQPWKSYPFHHSYVKAFAQRSYCNQMFEISN